MSDLDVRPLAKLVVLLALPMVVSGAQTAQQAGTLTIAGQSEQAALVRINGKSYVDVESLARLTHGSIQFQGSRTILTLPGAGSGATGGAAAPAQATKLPELSGGYLSAGDRGVDSDSRVAGVAGVCDSEQLSGDGSVGGESAAVGGRQIAAGGGGGDYRNGSEGAGVVAE